MRPFLLHRDRERGDHTGPFAATSARTTAECGHGTQIFSSYDADVNSEGPNPTIELTGADRRFQGSTPGAGRSGPRTERWAQVRPPLRGSEEREPDCLRHSFS